MLVVGGGATLGAIEEAVDKLRAEKHKVSSVHLRFLSPLEPGLEEIFSNFKKVITIEINYSDDVNFPLIDKSNRRYAQLAMMLRAQTLVDIDCWSNVHGQPMQPGLIYNILSQHLETMKGAN